MARTLRSDKLLFWATILLVAASVVMVYSASVADALDQARPTIGFFAKQMAWATIGIGLLLTVMRVDYHTYQRPQVIWGLLGVTVFLLLAVFLFPARNGATRWIGAGGFTLQPSELAKLAVAFFTAAFVERRMHRIDDVGYALMPVLIVASGLIGLIVLQPDLGTSAMIGAIVGAILFAAGLSYRYVVGGGLLALSGVFFLVFLYSWRMKRIMAFIDPWSDPFGSGYQIIQSFIAIGSGGVFGRGLMNGVQKLNYLPEAHTDFIFSVIGEEFGLIGTTIVLACFVVIAWRGLRAALRAPDRFGALLAIGLTAMLAVQGLINMSVTTGLLPNKGIPLPFVSSGGSSLLVNLIAMGILLNISQRASPLAAGLEERA
ncbi:MAG: putative lipid II flippase FtsW [Vicinamibacterales bacterium]